MSRLPTGTVQKDGERFRARVQLHGIRYSETHATEMEAWAWINALISLSQYAPKKPPQTLLSVGRERLDERDRDRVTRHIKRERSLWRTHVEPWPRALRPIKDLERVHVRDFIRDKARSGLAPATVRKILQAVRSTLGYAHDAGIADTNVAAGLRAPRASHDTDAAWHWLRQEEIDRVLKATADDPELHALYAVAIYVGLRKSEILHLQWENVTLDGPRPEIRVRAPLKTAAALRSVPLLPVPLAALAAWKAAQKPSKVTRIERLVWPGRAGRRHETYSARWLDKSQGKNAERTPGIRTKAKIDRPVRFHDLRHTCASHLVQGTWKPAAGLYQVAQWMGHSNITVTQRYAHLAPDGLHADVAPLHLVEDGDSDGAEEGRNG